MRYVALITLVLFDNKIQHVKAKAYLLQQRSLPSLDLTVWHPRRFHQEQTEENSHAYFYDYDICIHKSDKTHSELNHSNKNGTAKASFHAHVHEFGFNYVRRTSKFHWPRNMRTSGVTKLTASDRLPALALAKSWHEQLVICDWMQRCNLAGI